MLDDYDAFLTGLEQDPYQGTSLGKGVRKVRMAIASKGKGKRKLNQKLLKGEYEV